ncbi:MAG: GNAT family N-acetyltransferase [Candidatus Poseidoniaceae archaeon]|nr:GNAT family N-acetyltransferase [Candidatus Poseidoniaceae archaeon]
MISAWLVVEFDGAYTEGSPAPTEINALVVVDKDETLIDVKMERSTSFILYMLYRDYDSSYGQNESNNSSQDNTSTNDESDGDSNSTDDSLESKDDNTSPKEWLKLGRNSIFFAMVFLIISEIIVISNIRFSTIIRVFAWTCLMICFIIVLPSTYLLDLAGEDGDEDAQIDEEISQKNFVESTESGSMVHENNIFDSELMLRGIRFNLEYSGYDLGLVEPEEYAQLRAEVPQNNSSLTDSYVEFESTLELEYGKNLPSLLLIPLTWYFIPARPRKNKSLNTVTKPLSSNDVPMMWEINEQGLPGTGQVTQAEMAKLLDLSEVSLGAYQDGKLAGFVLCLLPKAEYGSLNYAWFNQRYDQFIYVDRIAVAKDSRNSGIGTLLYQQVFDYASQHGIPVTAEVSLKPSNEGSDRFHLRQGFVTIGELDHGDKAVTMYIKDKKPEDD